MDSETDDLVEQWAERERYWRRRLGRLRLGVEPIDAQLERLRRVTWGLTIVPGVMGSILIALFSAFGTPLIGLAVAGLIFGPMVAIAWLDLRRIERRAREYEAERQGYERKKAEPAEEV